MKTNILLSSAILLLFIIILFLTYAPVTRGHYLSAEDYGYVWVRKAKTVNSQSYIDNLREIVWEGRPLETLYTYLIFNKYINALRSIEAANTARLIGVIGTGLLAYVMFLIFKINRFRTDHAFLLGILICTLPPIQTYVSMVYTVIFVFSVLLSALSALILFKAVFREDKQNNTAHITISVLIAMILFIISLNIYQPTAMIYWAMAVTPLIIKDENFTKKRLLFFTIYFSAGFASMLIYMGITKIIGLQLNAGLSYRGAFINRGEIYERIIWFINYPLYGALNLWNIFPAKRVALFVSILIVSGMLYGFGHAVFQIITKKKRWIFLWRHFIILPLIPLSFLPNILAVNLNQLVPLHRYLIALEIILLLLLYWSLINIADIFKSAFNFSANPQNKIISIGLITLTVIVTFLANHNVDKYFSDLHTKELKYIKNIIQEYGASNLSKASCVFVIKPDKHSLYEFGVLSSLGDVGSTFMVRLALYELGINSDIQVEPISFIDQPNWQLPKDSNVFVIDMRKFLRQALNPNEFVVYKEAL
ncbi:MAG: glucosyltransferase domain-containing protein [Nitrospirae bacterium]|nr:glucosyltransferase domain-containing protein [Nitrospirota bacterium]